MSFYIRSSIGLLILLHSLIIVGWTQVKFMKTAGNEGAVEVTNQTLKLQAHGTLNLAWLYKLTKDQLKANTGIEATFASQYGSDGSVEIRVFTYDEQLNAKGPLIFGCRSNQSGFHAESWDAQSYYEHWYSWKKHEVPSTDIKFLAQDEHVGAKCENPPASFWSKPSTYAMIGLESAAILTALAIAPEGFALGVVPGFIALGVAFAQFAELTYGTEYMYNKNQAEIQAFYNEHAKFDNAYKDRHGAACSAKSFANVLIEVEIKNAKLNRIAVPGISNQIIPAVLFPTAPITGSLQGITMEESDVFQVSKQIGPSNHITGMALNGLTYYPKPSKMIVPRSPGYSGFIEVKVPEDGRFFVIATPERVRQLSDVSYYFGNVAFLSEEDKNGQRYGYEYGYYCIVDEPGKKILLDVNQYGPFFTASDIHYISRVTPPLTLMLEALDHPDRFPNYVMVAAHRGYWRNAPENSLEAINDCIDFGVDMVEIDVRKTQDGKLVMAHDLHLGRLTTIPSRLLPKADANGRILISNLTLCEIRPDLCGDNTSEPVRLKLLDGKETAAEPMPTFKEVLEFCKDRVIVDVDKIEGFFYEVFQDAEVTGTTHQVVVKGRFETPDDLLNTNKVPNTNLIDWQRLRFTPVYFSDFGFADYGASINAFLTDTRLNVPGVELIYRNDSDPLLQHKATIQQSNNRVIQFPQYPENCEGVYNPKKFMFSDIDPRVDFRNDYEWLLTPSRKPDLLISDRLEILMHILDIRGMRDITKVNPN